MPASRVYRDLAPAPVLGQDDVTHSRRLNAAQAGDGASSRPPRKRHTTKQWSEIKELILSTYATNTLLDTIRIVKSKTGFEAGVRQYKNKLTEWNAAAKYFKEEEMTFISKRSQARQHMGVSTTFLIRGAQIDPERIRRFDARSRSTTNPILVHSPGVTPDGIFYYTPADLATSPDTLVRLASVHSPLSAYSNLTTFRVVPEAETIAARLMQYGNTTRRIEMLDIEFNKAYSKAKRARNRESQPLSTSDEEQKLTARRNQQKALSRYDSGDEADSSLRRHVHTYGSFYVAAAGVFREQDTLRSLLLEGNNLAVQTLGILQELSLQTSRFHQAEWMGSGLQMPPSYAVVLGSDASRTNVLSHILQVIQSNEMISRLMCGTDLPNARWKQPWRRLIDGEMTRLRQTAEAIYGVCPAQGTDIETIVVLVHFDADATALSPSLLRIVLVENCSHECIECRACEDFAISVDYIGSQGSVKLQIPQSSFAEGVAFECFESLSEIHLVKQNRFFTKWTRLVNLKQGLSQMQHMRRCYCNGVVHTRGYRPHYINMTEERRTKHEIWDPMPKDNEGDTNFDCFPAEGSETLVIVENEYASASESEDDHWDPLGQERSITESFDPYPSEDERDCTYESKPIFRRLR